MKSHYLALFGISASVLFSSGYVLGQQKQQAEEKAIIATLKSLQNCESEAEFRRLTTTPYVSMWASDRKPVILRNQTELNAHLKRIREEMKQLPQGVGGPVPIVPPTPLLSNIAITQPNRNTAYVSYNYKMSGATQPATPLLAVMRKEKNQWKVTFAMLD